MPTCSPIPVLYRAGCVLPSTLSISMQVLTHSTLYYLFLVCLSINRGPVDVSLSLYYFHSLPKISPVIPYALAWNLKYHAMLFLDAQRWVVQEGVRQNWPVDWRHWHTDCAEWMSHVGTVETHFLPAPFLPLAFSTYVVDWVISQRLLLKEKEWLPVSWHISSR